MSVLRRRLAHAGFPTCAFGYRSVSETLAVNAARLAEFVAAMPGETVHLLGHSLGGVVICEMLERHAPERVGRIVCLGSPFGGSVTGRRLARLPGGRRIIGRTLDDLHARGGFGPSRGRYEIGVIAGAVPFGVGRLLGPFPEPNDGTVAVAETRLAGATDHIVLPVAHTALLWSVEVARQTQHFFICGRFDR